MGYMRHNAILVSSFDMKHVLPAYEKAFALWREHARSFPAPISGIVQSPLNGIKSFAVFPDGSKEGWEDSDNGDDFRREFVKYLDGERWEDGSTSLDWVEVQYGDDEGETKIVRDADEAMRVEDQE